VPASLHRDRSFLAHDRGQVELSQASDRTQGVTPQAVVDRLYAFEHHYNEIAKPFDWNFTRRDLADLITRIAEHEPRLRLAA